MSEITDGIFVYAPSYKRGKKKSPTQEYLPFVTMVVAESEAEEYRKSGHRVLACPDKVQGNLCRVRNWIMDQTFAKKGCRGLLLLDDDYSGLYRWRNLVARKMSAPETEEFIEMGFAMAEQWGAYQWGIGIVPDKGAYREGMPFCTVRYVGGPFQAFRPNPIRYDEKLPLKEDYDIYLQHLNKFRIVLRLNQFYYVVKQNEQAGGCATYRNRKFESEQFDDLRRKWGTEIVRIDEGNDKVKVRKAEKTFDLNPIISPPIDGV